VILTQNFFVRGESGLTKSERFVWIARGQQQPGKIAARVIGVRVLGSSAFSKIASARS
jgi:hypothetical protein